MCLNGKVVSFEGKEAEEKFSELKKLTSFEGVGCGNEREGDSFWTANFGCGKRGPLATDWRFHLGKFELPCWFFSLFFWWVFKYFYFFELGLEVLQLNSFKNLGF